MFARISATALFALLTAACTAQQAQPAPAACHVPSGQTPSEADQAFADRKFEDAERLYTAMPPSPSATAGIVRARLAQHKLDDALTLIQRESGAHPGDALLLDVLGEVRFRRGEVFEAAGAFNRSVVVDPCLARTHYDMARYMNFNGLYASAQKQLDKAHQLAPDDSMISRAWIASQHVPFTPEEEIANLRKRADDPASTPEQKTAAENAIGAIQTREKGDCQLSQSVTTARIPLFGEFPNQNTTREPFGSGVDIFFNGKRRRFRLDTGASGLIISADAAKSLGLAPEAETFTSGFGDSGPRNTYLAHVDNVKIGDLEFHNCIVRVLESSQAWHADDGLLGVDTFRNFLVTLDFPSQQMRLGPLPKRPDDDPASATQSLGTTGDSDTGRAALTLAERKRDRFVAPGMSNWVRIFRSGHNLIFPTSIGNAPARLFIMDTGATRTVISPDAAREVTHVGLDSDRKFGGISGDVKNVYSTSNLSITFANVRQQEPAGLTAIDLSKQSNSAGVEISGFIGYALLCELVIDIDYRDNLVHVTYSPHIEPGRH